MPVKENVIPRNKVGAKEPHYGSSAPENDGYGKSDKKAGP